MNIQRTAVLSLVSLLSYTGAGYAQNKVKTITIVNGDTTISEKNMDEKELADIDKQIQITINDDGNTKKVVKKVIINNGKNDGDAMAYAYSLDEGKELEAETNTDGKGNTTKIIIKNDDGKPGSKEEKKVIRRSSVNTDDESPAESVSINISIENTTAKVNIETGSKEALNVSVLDEEGKQVFYDSQKQGGKYSKEIKLEKKGTYFLNIIQNKKSTSEKIIIK